MNIFDVVSQRIRYLLLYPALVLAGGAIGLGAAPQIEEIYDPVLTDVYLVPWDAQHSDALYNVQLDRICWKKHVHKARNATATIWALAIVQNGQRIFTSPIDGRTGDAYSTLNTREAGFDGVNVQCTYIPNNFDYNEDADIESYGRYKLPGHFWTLGQKDVVVHVPALAGRVKP